MTLYIRHYILIGLTCIAWSPLAYAADFFEILYDVPILLDLEEIPEQALSFDKPSGRIAHSAAHSSYAQNTILDAYHTALPEMGWQKLSDGQFRREGEILSISIIKSDTSLKPDALVEFSLKPAEE